MATEHFCIDSTWQSGGVSSCSKHEKNRNAKPVKWGKKARAKMDRDRGVVGESRGGVYSDPRI